MRSVQIQDRIVNVYAPGWTVHTRWGDEPTAVPSIIIFSITVGGIIVAEASLSFLGFGLPPEVPGDALRDLLDPRLRGGERSYGTATGSPATGSDARQ